MSTPDSRTEIFRDLWLPPVETVADLPADPEPDSVCFVREDGRAWIYHSSEGEAAPRWTAMGTPRPPASPRNS